MSALLHNIICQHSELMVGNHTNCISVPQSTVEIMCALHTKKISSLHKVLEIYDR